MTTLLRKVSEMVIYEHRLKKIMNKSCGEEVKRSVGRIQRVLGQ